MEREKVEAIEPTDVVVLNENTVRSTHSIGAVGQQRIARTLNAPNLGGRSVLAVHLQPRGGSDSDNEAFAVRVSFISSQPQWRANVLIARVDTAAGWSVNLQIDALWITS